MSLLSDGCFLEVSVPQLRARLETLKPYYTVRQLLDEVYHRAQ